MISRDGYANYVINVPYTSAAGFYRTNGILIVAQGTKIFIAEDVGHRIRVFDLTTNYLSTLAGNGTSGYVDGTGSAALFNRPFGIVQDSFGNFFVSERGNCCIRKVTQAGVVTTFSGNCTSCGYLDGSATTAKFNYPKNMAIDSNNTIYVANLNSIRKVLTDGSVSTFAGSNSSGSSDGALLSATFFNPQDIKFDKNGTGFVVDHNNHRIRMIASGTVSTYAGSDSGYMDGVGTNAKFNYSLGLAIDNNGNDRMRRIRLQFRLGRAQRKI